MRTSKAMQEIVGKIAEQHGLALDKAELARRAERRQRFLAEQAAALAEQVTAGLEGLDVPLRVAVMGCVVNGPGEARETDIGITGGGAGKHMVYLSGVTDHHVQDEDMVAHIVRLVEAKAAEIDAGISQTMDVTHGKQAA